MFCNILFTRHFSFHDFVKVHVVPTRRSADFLIIANPVKKKTFQAPDMRLVRIKLVFRKEEQNKFGERKNFHIFSNSLHNCQLVHVSDVFM